MDRKEIVVCLGMVELNTKSCVGRYCDSRYLISCNGGYVVKHICHNFIPRNMISWVVGGTHL